MFFGERYLSIEDFALKIYVTLFNYFQAVCLEVLYSTDIVWIVVNCGSGVVTVPVDIVLWEELLDRVEQPEFNEEDWWAILVTTLYQC